MPCRNKQVSVISYIETSNGILPLLIEQIQTDAGSQTDPDGDKLGCGEGTNAATDQISPDKFYEKSADAVKEQVKKRNASILMRLARTPDQNQKMQKIQCRGNQLRGQKRHSVRSEV